MIVPAFVDILPLKVAIPPLAIAALAAGVQSSAAAFAGEEPTAGSAVNSAVAAVLLLGRALAVMSSENCVAGVAVFAWKDTGVSVMNTFRTCRSDVVTSGAAMLPPRRNDSASRSEMPAAGKRA